VKLGDREMIEQVSVERRIERRILTSARHRAALVGARIDGCVMNHAVGNRAVGNHPSGPSVADCCP
jgi:hypothetical protein